MTNEEPNQRAGERHDRAPGGIPVDVPAAVVAMMRSRGIEARICGWAMAGGRESAPFPRENPWRLRDEADPAAVLVRLWGGVEPEYPTFVADLGRDLVGIVMLHLAGGYSLVYLHAPSGSSSPAWGQPARRPVTDVPRPTFGSPPRTFPTASPVGAWDRPVPAAIRAVAAVHGRMTSDHGSIELDTFGETLRDAILEWERDDGAEDDDTTPTSAHDEHARCVCIGDHVDGWLALLMLDHTDSDGTPVVAYYDQDGLGRGRTPFREWFDQRATHHLIRRPPARGGADPS